MTDQERNDAQAPGEHAAQSGQPVPNGTRFRRVVTTDGRHGVLDLSAGHGPMIGFWPDTGGEPERMRWRKAEATDRVKGRPRGQVWLKYTSPDGEVRMFAETPKSAKSDEQKEGRKR